MVARGDIRWPMGPARHWLGPRGYWNRTPSKSALGEAQIWITRVRTWHFPLFMPRTRGRMLEMIPEFVIPLSVPLPEPVIFTGAIPESTHVPSCRWASKDRMASGPVTFDEKKCDMTCFKTGCAAPAALTEMVLPTPSALKLSMFSLKSISRKPKTYSFHNGGFRFENRWLEIIRHHRRRSKLAGCSGNAPESVIGALERRPLPCIYRNQCRWITALKWLRNCRAPYAGKSETTFLFLNRL